MKHCTIGFWEKNSCERRQKCISVTLLPRTWAIFCVHRTDLLPSFAAGLMLMIDWLKEGRDGAEEVFT